MVVPAMNDNAAKGFAHKKRSQKTSLDYWAHEAPRDRENRASSLPSKRPFC